MSCVRKAFTLVEILIVVVILGILSAIVVPQFASATSEATEMGTFDQLSKIRNTLAVYYVRNGNAWPTITPGIGTWGELIAVGYMEEPPTNLWVGNSDAGRTIVFGAGPDAGYQTTHGWIFNPLTGDIWAGSYDADDKAYPRP